MQNFTQQCFHFNIVLMKLLALYPPNEISNLYRLRACTIYGCSLIPAALFGVLGLFLKEDSKLEDYNSFVIVGMVLYIPKFLPFIKNAEAIKECILFFNYKSLELTQSEHQEIFRNTIYVCRRNSRIFFSGMMMGWITWSIKPLFWEEKYQLPMKMWLPFDIKNPVAYICTYVFLVIGVGYAGIACGIIDPLIWGLVHIVTSELKILKFNLQHFDEVVNHKFADIFAKNVAILKDKLIYYNIKSSILHYQKILRFVNKYQECFSQVIFSQLAGSIFVIGLCCLQMSKIQLYSINSFMMISYLCFILLQIYFSCYYGTNLYEENNTVCTAIYMGNWYNYDLKTQKALLILMERSKRPMYVTVGAILNLSLETFTTIIKRSYSLVALLQNFE